ncbi:MAG: cusA 1 [Planctomycetota bacterium]|nr:cusA 1 [Planctomycetota bacterium]
MIESVIEWSIRNRFLVIVASLVIGVVGFRALMMMPVDAIPDLSENQDIVFTDWMGRSPQEIEDQVTYPLSVNLQGLASVKVVRSSSEFNFSMITIIFNDDTDYYFASRGVLEKLSIASTFLPQGVLPYIAPDATAVGQNFLYTIAGEGKDLSELRSLQDWYVRYQLNSVPGVSEVASVGGVPKEYQIDLDPQKLCAYAASDPGTGHPSPPPEASNRRGGDSLDRPDALGHGGRGRGHAADGGSRPGRATHRRRGDRRLPPRALFRRSEMEMAKAPSARADGHGPSCSHRAASRGAYQSTRRCLM